MQMSETNNGIMIVMDKPYFTRSGAMAMMGIKSTALSREIKEKRISVFKHPVCDLFSREAIEAWILNRTQRAKK